MSTNWFQDIYDMHAKFGVHDWVQTKLNEKDRETLKAFLEFRVKCITEEYEEMQEAFAAGDPEEFVDALIDMMVFAIGTLEVFGVDANKAWSEVHRANMDKTPGVKESRPNPLGLPDLIKNPGWQGPVHSENWGILDALLEKSG